MAEGWEFEVKNKPNSGKADNPGGGWNTNAVVTTSGTRTEQGYKRIQELVKNKNFEQARREALNIPIERVRVKILKSIAGAEEDAKINEFKLDRDKLDYLRSNEARLKALGLKVDLLIFTIESNFEELLADGKFGEVRKLIGQAQKEGKLSAQNAKDLLKTVAESEKDGGISQTIKIFKLAQKMVEKDHSKVPAAGIPRGGKQVLLNPRGITILVNSDKKEDRVAADNLLGQVSLKDLDTKDKDQVGLSLSGSTYSLRDIGEIRVKVEKIGEGDEWKEDLLYSTVDPKHQKMLRELGFLQDEADLTSSKFKRDGVELLVQVRVGWVEGRYCHATKQAMGLFYAGLLLKDKESPLYLGHIKNWNLQLYLKLLPLAEAKGTGDLTPLENIMGCLDPQTYREVLEETAKHQQIDARFNPENIARLTKAYEEYQKTGLAVYFKTDADKVSGALSKVVESYLFEIEGGKVSTISLAGGRYAEFKKIAEYLSKIRSKSGQPYLACSPEKALEAQNRGEFVKAIYVFYMENAEEITGKKGDRVSSKRIAESLLTTGERLKDNLKFADGIEKAIRKELGFEGEQKLKEYTCLRLGPAFNKVLEAAYKKQKALEVEAYRGPASPSRVFDVTTASSAASEHPFASLIYAISKEQGKNPEQVNDVITRPQIDRIIDFLYPQGEENSAAYRPYVHYLLSKREKAVLEKVIAKSDNPQLISILKRLIAQKPHNPAEPEMLGYRVFLSETDKLLLDMVSLETEPGELSDILFWVRTSFSADYEISWETRGKLVALRDWMKTHGVFSLNSNDDYRKDQSNDPSYLEGIAVIRTMANAARIGFSIGDGVVRDRGFWSNTFSRVLGIAKQTLFFSVNPQSVQVGVPGGVPDDRLLVLKRQYWADRKIKDIFSAKLVKAKELKAKIDQIEKSKDPTRKKELAESLEEYNVISSQLQAQFATIGFIDKDFFDWFANKYLGDGKEKYYVGFLSWINREFFDVRAYEDPYAKKQISFDRLKELLVKAKDDPKLNYSGWQIGSKLRKLDSETASAEQLFGLFVTYVSEEELKSGEKENVSPVTGQSGQIASGVFGGIPPAQNFGEMVRNTALYLTQGTNPLERMEIWSASFTKGLNELDSSDVYRLAEIFRQTAARKGLFEKYKATHQGLLKIAKEYQGKKILLTSNDFKDAAKIIFSAYFLINLLYSGAKIESNNGTLRIVEGEGRSKESGEEGLVSKGGKILGYLSPIPPELFSSAWHNSGTDQKASLAEAASPLVGVPASFGPWMGFYFGVGLPATLIRNLGRSIGVLFGGGDETLELDENMQPMIDDQGNLKSRKLGPQELLNTMIQLPLAMFLFRNTPVMFYGMLNMWENIRQIGKAWKRDDNSQVALHLLAFALKFWIANFFVMTSPDGRFLNSTFGRGITLDRHAFKALRAIARLIKLGLKNRGLINSDPSLRRFRRFLNKHSRLRAVIEKIEYLPEKGILGVLGETVAERRAFAWFMRKSLVKGAVRVAGDLINPLGNGMEKLGEWAQDGSVAAHYGNIVLQRGLFNIFFNLSRADMWLWKGIKHGKKKIGDRLATRGAKTPAEREFRLRQAQRSDNLVGELNPNERVFVINSPPAPELGSFSSDAEKKALYQLQKDFANPEILISLNSGGKNPREQKLKLKLKHIKIDSFPAQFFEDGIAIGFSKPSALTPNEQGYLELHIDSRCLGLSYDQLKAMVEQKIIELKTKGINHPMLYSAPKFLTAAELSDKAKLQIADALQPRLENVFNEENFWKLQKVAEDLGITEINAENWEEVRKNLARTLVEGEGTASTELAKLIWKAGKELKEGIDYNPTPTENIENGRPRVALTDVGRKALSGIAGPEAGFALVEQVGKQVEYEIEMNLFAQEVEAGFVKQKDQLKKLSDRELRVKVSEFYPKAGKLTWAEKIQAAVYFQEAVRRAKGYKNGLRRGQLKAAYAGSLAGPEHKVAVDQGTGEGKTVTTPLAVFLQFLNGKKVSFVNTTTETLSKKDLGETGKIYELLGIESSYIPRSGMSDSVFRTLAQGNRVVLYCSFDTVRFRQLFDGLARGTYGTVLPADKSKIFIFLDEGDYLVADLRNSPAIISSATGSKAADSDLVREADRIVRATKWIDTSGNLTVEGEKYLEVDSVAEEVKIKPEGFNKIKEKTRKAVDRSLHEYLRHALHAHKFMVEGTHYKHDRLLRCYVVRDVGTGRSKPSEQLEGSRHKALQAKIGLGKITEPGLSSIALVVPDALAPYGAVALYSGSIFPLASHLAQEGYLSIPNESDFARTRIDYPAIMVRDHAAHVRQVAETIVEQLLEGKPVLAHVPQVVPKGKNAPAGANSRGLNSQEVHAEVMRQIGEIKNNPQHPLRAKYDALMRIIKEEGRTGIEDISLTDDKKEESNLRKMGRAGVVTYSDVANRGTDPKLKENIRKLAEAGKIVQAGFACVTTEWKTTTRHYLQEIARVARPNGDVRDPGSLFAIYSLEDRNFDRHPEVRAFFEKGLLKSGVEAIPVSNAEHPETDPTGEKPWDKKAETLKLEAEWLLRRGVLTKEQADAYAKDGTMPAEARDAIELVSRLKLAQDKEVNEALFSERKTDAEKFLRELDLEIKVLLEQGKSIAPILQRALLKALDLELEGLGITDVASGQDERIALFLKKIEREYGLKIKLPPGIEPWQIKQEIEKAVKKHFASYPDNPEGKLDREKIAEVILKRIAQARDYLSALSHDIDNPQARIFFAGGATMEHILSGEFLARVIDQRVMLGIARGPVLGLEQEGEVDPISGRYKRESKLSLERIGLSRTEYRLGLAEIDLTAVTSEVLFEEEMKGKLEALKSTGGRIAEGVELKVSYEGQEYDLGKEGDVKKLNSALEKNSSNLRIFWTKDSSGQIRFIYGETDPMETERGFRLLRLTKEIVSHYGESLAFIVPQKRTFLGETEAYEIISRPEQIAKSFDHMVEAAFDAGKSFAGDPHRSALALIMFRGMGVLTAADAKRERAALMARYTAAIEAHEKGHFSTLSENIPERTADFYLMAGGHLDSIYELMAEFHEGGRLGFAASSQDLNLARFAVYSFLFEGINSNNPIYRKMAHVLLGEVIDKTTGRINLEKLKSAREKGYRLLQTSFTPVLEELKGETDPEKRETIVTKAAERYEGEVEKLFTKADTEASAEAAKVRPEGEARTPSGKRSVPRQIRLTDAERVMLGQSEMVVKDNRRIIFTLKGQGYIVELDRELEWKRDGKALVFTDENGKSQRFTRTGLVRGVDNGAMILGVPVKGFTAELTPGTRAIKLNPSTLSFVGTGGISLERSLIVDPKAEIGFIPDPGEKALSQLLDGRIKITEKKIKGLDDLERILKTLPDNVEIVYESGEVVFEGTKAALEVELFKTVVGIKMGDGKIVEVAVYRKDIQAFAGSVSPESNEYKEAIERIRGAIKEAIPDADLDKSMEELKQAIKGEMVSLGMQAHFKSICEREALRVLEAKLSAIDPNLPRSKYQKEFIKAHKAARKAAELLQRTAFEEMFRRTRDRDVASMTDEELRKVAEEASQKVRAKADKVAPLDADGMQREIDASAESFRMEYERLSKPSDHQELKRSLHYGLPGASIGLKVKVVGKSMGRGAGFGILLGGLISAGKRLIKGERGWELVGSSAMDSFDHAKGFVQFEAMNSVATIGLGKYGKLGRLGAQGFALGLPILWSLGEAGSGQRGVVLTQGLAGIGAFMAVSAPTGVGISKVSPWLLKVLGVASPKWMKGISFMLEGVPLALGMLANEGVSSYMEDAMSYSPKLRRIMTHPVGQAVGDILGDSNTTIAAWSTASIAGRFLAKRGLTTIGARVLGSYVGGPMAVLAAANLGVSAYYRLSYGDYQRHTMERIMEDLKGENPKALEWIGDFTGAKSLQKVKFEEFLGQLFHQGSITHGEELVYNSILKNIGRDFEETLSFADNFYQNYIAQAAEAVLRRSSQIKLNDPRAVLSAGLDYLCGALGELTSEIVLNGTESRVFAKIQEANPKDWFDEKFVSGLISGRIVKDKKEASAVLEKIAKYCRQSQIKQALSVNPSSIGFILDGPEKMAVLGGGSIYAGTAIAKRSRVQDNHDVFAYYFNPDGTLKRDKIRQFAERILNQKVNGKSFQKTVFDRPLQLISRYYTAQRMLELLKQQGGLNGVIFMQPSQSDIEAGLVVRYGLTHWSVDYESEYYQAWVQAKCSSDPENAHLVLAQMVTKEDKALGLVTQSGLLNFNNRHIVVAFNEMFKETRLALEKERASVYASLARARAESVKWQEKHLRYFRLANKLQIGGKAISPRLQKALVFVQKKLESAYLKLDRARAQVNRLKIQIAALQKKWFEEKEPLKKQMFAMQIKALGGNTDKVTKEYCETVGKGLKALETTDYKKEPQKYVEIIEKLVRLVA